jgi:hypothetical protein
MDRLWKAAVGKVYKTIHSILFKMYMNTFGYPKTNLIIYKISFLQHLFVLRDIKMYVFSDNPYQAQSLQHSYRPTQLFEQEEYNTKLKVQLYKQYKFNLI